MLAAINLGGSLSGSKNTRNSMRSMEFRWIRKDLTASYSSQRRKQKKLSLLAGCASEQIDV